MNQSEVIKRLKEEVKNQTTVHSYDRVHNRHNRGQ